MVESEKQVGYWREEASSSWDDARYLMQGGRIDFGMFAVHLALEKAVKAHVVKATNDFPPRIHNLLSLAQLASLTLPPEHERTLAKLNTFNIRGRYRDMPVKRVSPAEAQSVFELAEKVFEWLMKQL